MLSFVIFFFKHMTAYEMRISDWSSDVCSSDLSPRTRPREVPLPMERLLRDIEPDRGGREDRADEDEDRPEPVDPEFIPRAGVEHEVAQAREEMLEEGPGQADQHDLAEDVGELMNGAGIDRKSVV